MIDRVIIEKNHASEVLDFFEGLMATAEMFYTFLILFFLIGARIHVFRIAATPLTLLTAASPLRGAAARLKVPKKIV